jgi:hypothetical protein
MAKTVGQSLQDGNCLFHNFWTNAVARENRKVQKHGENLVIVQFCNWVIENLAAGILSIGETKLLA